jgi:hypothetical protein
MYLELSKMINILDYCPFLGLRIRNSLIHCFFVTLQFFYGGNFTIDRAL